MKVLFANRDPRLQGGDTYKIAQYASGLADRGVETYYTHELVDFSKFDIIHIFHLGHEFSYKFFLEGLRTGKKMVLSPIYFPGQHNPTTYRREMMEGVDGIAALSGGEINAIIQLYSEHEHNARLEAESAVMDKCHIIPNGINPVFFEDDGPAVLHPNAPDEPYVLCVGRLDSRKNQIRLAQACRELDVPLFLVGDILDDKTAATVQSIANEWTGLWWNPGVDHEKLAEVYRGAHTLACPSTLEIWPNVVAEGGAMGCNLVVSEYSMSFTDLEGVYPCLPTIESIQSAVKESLSNEATGDLKDYFKRFTWENSVEGIYQMYQEVLSE
jgi:glycosyltransferase involved in cell wall biosynthesis